jgi:hypothetical protein
MVSTNPSYPSLALAINPRKKTVNAGMPKKRMSFFMVFRTVPLGGQDWWCGRVARFSLLGLTGRTCEGASAEKW